jgi:excisionase family DNA binding protein
MAEMLTVGQAAHALGVKSATVRSWIWKRQIEYVKVSRVVRISTDEVQRVIKCGTRHATGYSLSQTSGENQGSSRDRRDIGLGGSDAIA